MSTQEQLVYAVNVLFYNVFFDFEIPYYQGLELGRRAPHGVSHVVWQEAAKCVGFCRENLVETKDGRFYIAQGEK